MTSRYPISIEWSEEDQEFMATCPAFPGLSAFGASEEEALKEAKIALAGFIETHKANNMPLPEAADVKVDVKISKETGGAYADVRQVIESELARIKQERANKDAHSGSDHIWEQRGNQSDT